MERDVRMEKEEKEIIEAEKFKIEHKFDGEYSSLV